MVASCAGGGRVRWRETRPSSFSLFLSLSLQWSRRVSCTAQKSFPPPFWKNHFSSFSLPYFFIFFSFPVHFFVPYLFLLFSSMLSFLLLCVLIFFFLMSMYVYVVSPCLFAVMPEKNIFGQQFFSCVPAHVLFPQALQFLSLFCHIRRFPECVFELFSFPFSLSHLCLPIGILDSVVSIIQATSSWVYLLPAIVSFPVAKIMHECSVYEK